MEIGKRREKEEDDDIQTEGSVGSSSLMLSQRGVEASYLQQHQRFHSAFHVQAASRMNPVRVTGQRKGT